MKVNVFANQLWPQLEVTTKTISNYAGAFVRNLAPRIGDLQINEVTKNLIIETLAPLPSQTKYQTFMVARVLFREAVNRELVQDSPVDTIKTPKVSVRPQKFLRWEEIREIDFGYHTKRIHFLALHGLRYGEAAAMTEKDIIDNRVYINKSKYGATKSKAGVRSVPLMCEFVTFPKYSDKIAAQLRPYGVTVHSLRKTYAYLLKQANVHVTTAAKLLGHSNPLITMKIYTQVLDDEIDSTGKSLFSYLSEDVNLAK